MTGSRDFEGQAAQLIPAEVRMISGCQDHQTSADVGNVSEFQLPNCNGRSGGACTSALLKVLYNEDKQNSNKGMTFVGVLTRMRAVLKKGKYEQIPQLTSSRKMDVQDDFAIVPADFKGTKRALLVGINYVGTNGELAGCHNDVGNIKDYLVNVQGFQEKNITILMDDGSYRSPTKNNILDAFHSLADNSTKGDCAFFHYSGHGGRVKDEDGDEEDGYDETLIPVDYEKAGQIHDDQVFSELVGRMPEGSTLTCLMDCCHSGSVLDLPYTFVADGQHDQMEENPNAKMGKLQKMALNFVISKMFGTGVAGQLAMTVASSACGGGGGSNTSGLVSIGTVKSLAKMCCA